MKKSISSICVNFESTILHALRKLSKSANKCLIVVNNKKKFLGTISDGDIRRDILKNKNFSKSIKDIYNTKSTFMYQEDFTPKRVKEILSNMRLPILPILNKQKKPINYYSIYDLSPPEKKNKNSRINQIIIMAGGEGKRLHPFTSILPKPLIPIKNKPIISHLMNFFKSKNFSQFTISINKKDKVLKSYLNELSSLYDLRLIEEKQRLGTAGVLKKLDRIREDFFIINCDCLFNIDLSQLLSFHQENKYDITLVAAVKDINIPYGVCEMNSKQSILKNMIEKPKKSFVVNTGFYVCKPTLFKFLPNKANFGMDLVINRLLSKKRKVGVFPINGKDWKDVGNWTDYLNNIQTNTKAKIL